MLLPTFLGDSQGVRIPVLVDVALSPLQAVEEKTWMLHSAPMLGRVMFSSSIYQEQQR